LFKNLFIIEGALFSSNEAKYGNLGANPRIKVSLEISLKTVKARHKRLIDGLYVALSVLGKRG